MYNIHNTNIINDLTALTGDKQTAVVIYEHAKYLYETIKTETFHVRLIDKQWKLVAPDACVRMNKHLLNENES